MYQYAAQIHKPSGAVRKPCATASAVALTLPWPFNRLGLDPAFGSGPLATVIQDLLSVVIYLVIATAILE
jgi:magnesium transporter